jgi:hypothetical protein
MSFDTFDLIPSAFCNMGLHPRCKRKLDQSIAALQKRLRSGSKFSFRKFNKDIREYYRLRIRALTTTRDMVARDSYVASWVTDSGMTNLEQLNSQLHHEREGYRLRFGYYKK